jgi:hypothetical protein
LKVLSEHESEAEAQAACRPYEAALWRNEFAPGYRLDATGHLRDNKRRSRACMAELVNAEGSPIQNPI